ncbi:MAG TPA: MOSC N-terminal beta barrel domain-containing protein [Methylomirabilota bacterium]|jgi:hypothetical protein|nr:MOSC N-terminal beta barrel domain-containing protein [Methylomirabilota bacterium]
MHVAELWRYPVKSMAGERIEATEIRKNGIPGDRVVYAENGHARVLTARAHPGLLGFHATLGADGEPRVDGRPWSDPEIAARVRAAVTPATRLARSGGAGVFDVLPLLVATDGALAALGVDRRRLRPNIVIAGVEGLAERDWPGRRLRIGGALIAVAKLRGRCVMTTYDPDTQRQDLSVLQRIVDDFGGRMALDCAVLEPGRVARGDAAELL